MKNYGLTTALLVFASIAGAAPAFAFEIEIGDALCPIETIGEAELDSWSSTLVDAKGQLTDAQTEIFNAAVASCAEKLGWSQTDTMSVVEFNLSNITGTAMGDKLAAAGIEAVNYELVLDKLSADDLRQIEFYPESSATMKELTRLIVSDFGDDLTDEISADIAAYIRFNAQSRFWAMILMGLLEE